VLGVARRGKEVLVAPLHLGRVRVRVRVGVGVRVRVWARVSTVLTTPSSWSAR
jgi:hypothetical protein